MTQLQAQGWIHHLARHSVACFLTRGDLFISWEHGAKHFDKLLLDADWALNNGNWMWLSASCYFHQFFRVYSPVAFGKKTDKNGDYIRKWLPQLRHMPAKYIYEPWTAPRSVQEQAGCVVGVDYPAPIVDHKVVSKRNMMWMKDAYARHRLKNGGAADKAKAKKKAKAKTTTMKVKKRKKVSDDGGDNGSSGAKKQTTLLTMVKRDKRP
jgi:cryptochrome